MAQPIPTRLDLILLAVKARFVLWLEWDSSRVVIMDPERIPTHSVADQYVVLWPDNEDPNMPIIQGAGRLDARMTERFVITLRTRTHLDNMNTLESWLTDNGTLALGHLVRRHDIWDALIDFIPTDNAAETGNWLTVDPIKPSSGQRPRRGRIDAEGWGESSLFFTATYVLDLNQTFQ